MVEETRPTEDGEEPKPAPRRRTTRRTTRATPATQAGDANAEEAPKPATRRRRTRASTAPEADAPAQAAEAPATDEAPKPAPRRRRTRTTAAAEAAPAQEPVSAEEPSVAEAASEEAPKPRRSRRRSAARAAAEEPATEEAPVAETPGEEAPRPTRRRRTRRPAAEAPIAEARAAESQPPTPRDLEQETGEAAEAGAGSDAASGTTKRRRRSRRGGAGRRRQTAEGAVAGIPAAAPAPPEPFELPRGPRRKKSEAPPVPDDTIDVSFMHPSEREFAHLLDYYNIPYLYEPRSFPLRWDGDRVVEKFTPDFYLPEYDQYFELTTMKQSLVTQKNRKLRHVREVYPDINVQLLYRRDLMRLMGKYGFGPLADVSVEGTERVLYSEEQVRERVQELGRQLAQDYAGTEPLLIGVLRGVVVFMADLMREMDLPVQIEFMEISHYGEEREEAIEIIRDVGTQIQGRHVIVVEDIVDTGLTLRYLLEHLKAKKPASLKVCAMLDKSVRRMANIPIDYVGFEIPDEFVIGYGLDYGGRYRNLKYIGVLQPIEPKAVAQR